MNIEQLRYADAVAACGSFSGAARELGLSQPALSAAVARLEADLGVSLFQRSTRGVITTAAGVRLLPAVAGVLAQLDALVAEAEAIGVERTTTVRVGVSPLIGGAVISAAFEAARTLRDPVDLVLREADMDLLEQFLNDGDLDLLLIPAVRAMPRLHHQVIAQEPVVVIDPCGQPGQEPVEVDDVAGSAFILVPDTCGLASFTQSLFHAAQVSLRAYEGQASSYRVVDEWVGMGVAAAILPVSKVARTHTSCRPLLNGGVPVRMRYEAVWRPAAMTAPVVSELAWGLSAALETVF